MSHLLATAAALAIVALGMSIVALALVIHRLRALEAIETWIRSAVEDFGHHLTDLRFASDAQSKDIKAVADLDWPGSISSESGDS